MKYLLTLFIFLVFSFSCFSQKNLVEKLGYGPEDKLLIVHADDLGVSHAQNVGSFQSMEQGIVNSASIMVPCPWVSEVAEYYLQNPNVDFGLHLTLTNEWELLRWSSVAPTDQVSSILNEQGYMYPDCLEFGKHALVEEVEIELRAQIERALALGLKPTHLDAHMGCLVFSSPEIFEVFLKLGREYKMPCMVSRFFLKFASEEFLSKMTDEDVVIERSFTAGPEDYDLGFEKYYNDILQNQLMPGVQILLIHPAVANDELKAMARNHHYWGADWRQQDLDYFTSEKCKRIIEEQNIKLITWGEIQKAVYGEN